jgi:hypothetical protein
VLLPDGLFFSRAVPVTAGASPAEATHQIELALEAMSPFPLAQLYYGWFWTPGAERAFVYAAYRRRFTTDQTSSWADAELVAPASIALFGATVQPATTLILSAPEGLTAVHWEHPSAPSRVLFRALPPEATDEDRARLREQLLRATGGSLTVVDLLVPPVVDSSNDDEQLSFRSGDFVSVIPAGTVAALDVRDKGELASLRAARKRDLVLWRIVLGCAAALLILALGEAGLIGGQMWQKGRQARINARAGTVQKIREEQELATSIHDLVTKRFLPVEMVTTVLGPNGDRKPSDLVITRIQSTATNASRGSYTLVLELQTTNTSQVPVYRNELQKLTDVIDTVTVDFLGSHNEQSLYRVTVTFKPGVLKPEAA